MRYIHPSDERVLEGISGLSGHNSRHTDRLDTLPTLSDDLEVSENASGLMVSAAGLEPATHALKGHCSTN